VTGPKYAVQALATMDEALVLPCEDTKMYSTRLCCTGWRRRPQVVLVCPWLLENREDPQDSVRPYMSYAPQSFDTSHFTLMLRESIIDVNSITHSLYDSYTSRRYGSEIYLLVIQG
jgi:hypothetical protein